MTQAQHLRPVDLGSLPEYPVDADARLDSHGFIQWEFRRWMRSDMRWMGSHECKSIWFDLVNLAHDETPVGTLPADHVRLSRMVQPAIDPARFSELCALSHGPLHGWRPVLCDDVVRLAHPVVTRIVLQALASRANNAARVEANSEARRLARLTQDIGQLAPKLVEDRRKVVWIDQWIQQAISQRGGARRTAADLQAAIGACMAQDRAGRFPAKSTD